jgi:hypothetical protein
MTLIIFIVGFIFGLLTFTNPSTVFGIIVILTYILVIVISLLVIATLIIYVWDHTKKDL